MRRPLHLLLPFLLIAGTSFAQEPPPPGGGEPPGQNQPLKKSTFSLSDFENSAYTPEQLVAMEKIDQGRRQNIGRMEQLLRDQPLYKNKADIYFRLAESYWEQSKFEYLKTRAKFDKDSDAFEQKRLAIAPVEPKQDYATALGYYKRVIQEFPDYARLDEILYYLGRGALEQGKEMQDRNLLKEAVQYLQKLVQTYPQSPQLPKAFLALGEHFFETDSLYYAKTNYEKIITNFPTSPMLNYALYKLGWVYFNLREFRKTIDTFQKVVENIGTASGQISFRDQALDDLVKTWAEMDDSWREALEYFERVLTKGDPVWEKMEKLADLYIGFDKDKEATELFNHFLETRPSNAKAAQWFARLLEVRRKVNDAAETEKEVRRAWAYFQPDGSWMSTNNANTEAVAEANTLTENEMASMSVGWHESGQKADDKKNAGLAKDLYEKAAGDYAQFLSRFPDSEKAYVINFNLGEIQYGMLKDYAGAIKSYQEVIKRDKKGQFVEDAALGIIYASYEEMCKQGVRECVDGGKGGTGSIEKKKLSEDEWKASMSETIQKSDLHPLERAYVDAADSYVNLLLELRKDAAFIKKYPKRGEQIPEVMYLAADTYYKHGQFAEAVQRLQKIFEYDSRHKLATVAAVTIMEAYSKLARWDKVEEWARKLKATKNPFITDEQASTYIAIAINEDAVALMKAKRVEDAIGRLKQLVAEFGKSKDREMVAKATYNLAFLYERAKRTKEAVATYESIVKNFKGQSVAPEAQFQIGVLYESQTRFAESADAFLQMEKFKDAKDTPDAMINASLIREATNDHAGAIAALEKFLKVYPKHERAPNAFFKIGNLLEKMADEKSLKKAVTHYDAFAAKYSGEAGLKVQGWSRAGDILRALDEKEQVAKNAKNAVGAPTKKVYTSRKKATDYFTKAVNEYANNGKNDPNPENRGFAQEYAAQAAYWAADYTFQDFDDARIPATMNINALMEALKKKAELHQRAEASFDGVFNMGSAYWLGCAAFRNGLLYYKFVEELDSVPIPDVLLGTDGETQYRAALQTFADPINEKALILLKGALMVAHEKGVYNQCAKDAGIYTHKKDPDSFPVAGDSPLNKQLTAEHTQDTLLSGNIVRFLKRGNTAVDMLRPVKKAEGAN